MGVEIFTTPLQRRRSLESACHGLPFRNSPHDGITARQKQNTFTHDPELSAVTVATQGTWRKTKGARERLEHETTGEKVSAPLCFCTSRRFENFTTTVLVLAAAAPHNPELYARDRPTECNCSCNNYINNNNNNKAGE